MDQIVRGEMKVENSPMKWAPHTTKQVGSNVWDRKYTRQDAAWPVDYLKTHKFWPSVARVDNIWGDRNLFCNCYNLDEVTEKKQ